MSPSTAWLMMSLNECGPIAANDLPPVAPLHQTSSLSSQVANAAKEDAFRSLSVSQRAADKSFLAAALSSTLSPSDAVPPKAP